MQERTRYTRRERRRPAMKPSFDGSTPNVRRGLPTRSLADAGPGDVVEIADIFFEIVRDRCWELGIDRGEALECVAKERGRIVLANEEIGRVELESHYARFVSVRPVASGLELAWS